MKLINMPTNPIPFGRDTKPVILGISEKLKVNDVGHGESNPADHSGNRSLLVYFLGKDTHG